MNEESRRQQADESVATSFDRTMRATTSRWGFLCDVSLIAAISAVPAVLLARQALANELGTLLSALLFVWAIAPLVVSLGVSLALGGAREQVVGWIAAQPFAIDNLNALLVGISDSFEVQFKAPIPEREAVQPALDAISEDALYLVALPDEHKVEIKIGVAENKRLPLLSNHERYVRFQRIVEQVLVPLAAKHPIEGIRLV